MNESKNCGNTRIVLDLHTRAQLLTIHGGHLRQFGIGIHVHRAELMDLEWFATQANTFLRIQSRPMILKLDGDRHQHHDR